MDRTDEMFNPGGEKHLPEGGRDLAAADACALASEVQVAMLRLRQANGGTPAQLDASVSTTGWPGPLCTGSGLSSRSRARALAGPIALVVEGLMTERHSMLDDG